MKTKNSTLHQLTLEELRDKLHSLSQELDMLRMKKKAQKLDNTSQVRVLSDMRARILTIITEKERTAQLIKKSDTVTSETTE